MVGNLFTITVPDWLTFIGCFAGVVLTFLAGAEVDVPSFGASGGRASDRRVSFAAPLVVAMAAAYQLLGWTREQAEIGGTGPVHHHPGGGVRGAGRERPERSIIGKRIMAATFVTDILTVLGLSILFISPNCGSCRLRPYRCS